MAQQYKTRKRKKNIFWPVFIGVCLLIYIVIQWYLINRNKIETVKAAEGYINDSIMSVGVICREETVIDNYSDGHYYYKVDNGQRVSSGMLIGEIYPSENDIDLIYRSQDILNHIEKLEEAENFMSSVNVDISITRRQLSNIMVEFSNRIAAKEYGESYENMMDISLYLNKINVAMNREGDIAGTKQTLKDLNTSVLASVSQPTQSIYSSRSGYFMNFVDGYEDVASVENFKNMTYADGIDVMHSGAEINDDGIFGKIITNYKWSLCTYVTPQQAEKLFEGKKVKLSIDIETQKYQTVVVKNLIPKDDMVLVILEASTIDKDAASARVRDCEILFSQYKGIKVPKSAIRIVDGQMGVYVKFSKLVQFKKIQPVYQDENYIILPIGGDENNQVELYDDIIVKGVNLYDGKYL